MTYLTQLAAVARRTGFPVIEEAGWRSRGHGAMSTVRSVICHHDAARQGMSTFNTVIRDGHSTLAGPLAHYALRRDGTIHVVAAGLCWHAGTTTNSSVYGNSHAIGIEAGNDGVGEPWPRRQLDAYEALCAELCREFGLPVSRVQGHKEIAYPKGRKIDPAGINMAAFRTAVARRMTGGGGSAAPAPKSEPRKENLMPIPLPVGEHAQSFQIPEGAKKIAVNTPHGPMTVKALLFSGNGYPNGKEKDGQPKFDGKGNAVPGEQKTVDRLRPWRTDIPKGATNGAIYYDYPKPDSRYEYCGSLDFIY